MAYLESDCDCGWVVSVQLCGNLATRRFLGRSPHRLRLHPLAYAILITLAVKGIGNYVEASSN